MGFLLFAEALWAFFAVSFRAMWWMTYWMVWLFLMPCFWMLALPFRALRHLRPGTV